ncbi:WD40 repeat domain-containing protein [Candidatus Thiosymbion oneisti]|uniref:WD40 repeat domain-containing protein n=1 Tax=Candidatus Thiosymbion oneisti TaxID=589554 RepID=UPI000AA45DC9|nr:WD40 repeat domain-containing protein [Candidatus Thiosymbion oneisti]
MNQSPAPVTESHRPYPGLRPFSRDEADYFFGREEQIDQLLDKLAETHFLAVLGTSGSGKSSLVRAGLLPALASGVLVPPEPPTAGAVPYWSIAELRPGDRPFRRLAEVLIRNTGMGRDCPTEKQAACSAELEQNLRRGSRALNWRLGVQPLAPGERLLILVDQFEELFRFQREDAEEAAAFVALLLAAASHPDCYLVITMRSEFLGDCSRYPDLPEAINAGLFLTPRLSPEQLADAIQLPARLPSRGSESGGDVSPGLVRRLVDETAHEQDQLPLLQHLLMRLWDDAVAKGQAQPVLDESGLDALGGPNAVLGAALDRHADEAFEELDADQQQTAEILFRALTERAQGERGERDIRRPVRISEVAAIAGKTPQQVIDCTEPFRQADRNFLMPPLVTSRDQPLGADDTIDITHESLIRQWSRLQRWTTDESEQAELYRRLESAAQRWQKGEGALWIDPDLQYALDWRDRHQHRSPSAWLAWAARYGGDFPLAMQFLDASRDRREEQRAAAQARQRQKLRRAWITAGISVLALAFTLMLAAWAWTQQQRAIEEETKALAAEQQRTEELFESGLTHAALLARGEDYAAAWRVLGETVALDKAIPAERQHARNLLAGFVDLRRGTADQIYRGADAALKDLALSPDGRWLVAGGERGELVIFDARSGELVQRLEGHDPEAGTTASVRAVRFTADGGTMISTGDDRRIIHWSVPDWQIQHQWQAPSEVWSLALHPDGETLASAGKGNGITLWSMADGKQIRALTGESSDIADGTSLAWLPDGRLISGGFKGQVGIWDTATGEEQVLPRIHTDQVPAVAVSPDGGRIATGSADKTIILWDATGRPLRRLRGHRNLILGLAFDASGQRLLSASYDNDLRLWDLASGTTLRVFQGHVAGLWSVIVRDGYAYTAANDGTLRRWSLDLTGQWIWDLDQEPASALLLPSPAGGRIGELLIGFADGAVRGYGLLSPATRSTSFNPVGAEAERLEDSDEHTGPHSGPYPQAPVAVRTAAARLDAESAAATDAGDTPVAPSPNTPGTLRLNLPDAHDNQVLRFAVSPDGQTLATCSHDDTARVWHIQRNADRLSLEPLYPFDQHAGSVHAVDFSSDGRLLATAGYDGQVGLFDLKTGAGKLSQAAEFGQVLAVEFIPDGNQLISANRDERRIRLWQRDGLQLTNGRTITELSDKPLWTSLSPDGRRVAVVGRGSMVSIYDLDLTAGDTKTAAEPRQLVGHEQGVVRAIFDPDGRRLATVGGDMTVRVWDLGPDEDPAATTGQALFTLRLPTVFKNPSPLWDFDFRCEQDQAGCWIAVPLTIGRIALYRLPYAQPPADLRP